MLGFELAYSMGCDMVECDVRLSQDGIAVLSHDKDVQDTEGTRYVISQCSTRQLQEINLGKGEGVPTLLELAEWASTRCMVMADVKEEGEQAEKELVRSLAPLPHNMLILPGASPECRNRLRLMAPHFALSLSLDASARSMLWGSGFQHFLASLDTEAVTWQFPLITEERVLALHHAGKKVFAWTVDSLEIMKVLQAMGVDGIISNRMDLLAELTAS